MATAFDRLLADVDRDDPAGTMLAKLVIEIVRNGERDHAARTRREVAFAYTHALASVRTRCRSR
jgi:hypothetical protein